MEEALLTQAPSACVVVKGLEQGPTAACGQYGMLFSVGIMGKSVLSWGKKMQLLPDTGSIRIVLTYHVHISYSVLNTVGERLLPGPVTG